MKHRNSHLLVGYWSRLRLGRDVPDQTDIDPRAIKRMLAHVFIIDASDAGHPHYRLAGTSLCDRYGFELKNADYLAHWEGPSRASVALLLRQSLAAKHPLAISSLGVTRDGALVEMETILAPMSFGGDRPCRFIGITQTLSDPAPLPGRPITSQRLVSSQFAYEDEPVVTFAPPPPPPSPPPYRSHPKAPHLRLVASRETPLQCDMDETMQALIKRLDIATKTPIALVK
jgi:hypothetical protein